MDRVSKSDNDNQCLLSWELSGRQKTHGDKVWTLPIEAARYGLPILSGFVSFSTFWLTINFSGFIPIVNFIFIIGNVVTFIYSVIAVFMVRKTLRSGGS